MYHNFSKSCTDILFNIFVSQDEGVRCIRQMCEMTTIDQEEMLFLYCYRNYSGHKVARAIASYMAVMEEDMGVLLEEMLQDQNITREAYAEAQYVRDGLVLSEINKVLISFFLILTDPT